LLRELWRLGGVAGEVVGGVENPFPILVGRRTQAVGVPDPLREGPQLILHRDGEGRGEGRLDLVALGGGKAARLDGGAPKRRHNGPREVLVAGPIVSNPAQTGDAEDRDEEKGPQRTFMSICHNSSVSTA